VALKGKARHHDDDEDTIPGERDTKHMNVVPLLKKVAALSDEELTAAAMTYLDEDTATLHAAPYDDLHYRIVLLTEYMRRMSNADPARVEMVLNRVNHERQTREPHRVLGGAVPPLRDEVTVESVAKRPAGETLTRTRTIEFLKNYIIEGSKLTSGAPRRLGDVLRRDDPRTPEERWRDDVAKVLQQVDGAGGWTSLILPTDTSLPSMTRATELLGVLVCRIEAGRPFDLKEDHRDALATMSKLVIWADHLASLSNGNYEVSAWDVRDYETFLQDLPLVVDAAERSLVGRIDRKSMSHALALVRAHLDIDSFVARLNHRMFHAAWAMWALAWWMSDATNDRFTISHTPCATFREVKITRAEFATRGRVTCPRCSGEVSFARDELRNIELPMAQWTCRSCNIAGVFPEKTPPDSPWVQSPDPDTDLNAALDADAGDMAAQTHFEMPDLTWMKDDALQRIVTTDFAEMRACLAARAPKAALLLAGSACEAMLLEVLERNTVVTKSWFQKKPDDFPDRASLEQLVEVAMKEGLMTTVSSDFAPEMRKYRDLIHPHRQRRSDIKVNPATARLLANAAVVLAGDLADAAVDGRIAAFEGK
jgi:hypothetical protein